MVLRKHVEHHNSVRDSITNKTRFIGFLFLHNYVYEYGIITIKGDNMDDNKGNNFNCICDVHWEDMSILECKDCGTIIKYYYDEFYEPDFKCPVCTDYKTGYEFYTKEQIESSDELKAIIQMYKEFYKRLKDQDERIEKRNGLLDSQLCMPKYIKTKNNVYKFNLLIDSILNKNRLKGLRLEISRWEKGEFALTNKWIKEIPLSFKSLQYYRYRKKMKNNPELFNLNKSITQVLEETAVKRLKK